MDDFYTCERCGHDTHPLPAFVIAQADGELGSQARVYRVSGVISCGSRGREYRLSNKRGQIARVCFAPEAWQNVRSVHTSGETLTYCTRNGGDTLYGEPLEDRVER